MRKTARGTNMFEDEKKMNIYIYHVHLKKRKNVMTNNILS